VSAILPVAVQALSKCFGNIQAVKDVAFQIGPGEVFGYLGPNGSGKTTTIRCLMGLIRPTSGQATLFGTTVRPGKATLHHRVGYLPGDFRIWTQLTPRVALRVLAALGERQQPNQRRLALAERLGLDLDRPLHQLSKGNRQKVGVIQAFQHDPEILILDEPTSGLDPLMRQVVLDLIRERASQGAAILLSSHDLAEVSAVCQRAAILKSGRLIEEAPIGDLIRKGEHRLEVVFEDATPTELPRFNPQLGIRIIRHTSEAVLFGYHGSPDPLLQWLAGHRLKRLHTPELSLEEAFLQYYQLSPGPQVDSNPEGTVATKRLEVPRD